MACTNSCKNGVLSTLDKIGGKWKPLLIGLLFENNVLRNGEFRRLIPEISQKVLTQQLRELEADGLINRKTYNQLPLKVEYSLTDVGKSLETILNEMNSWGLKITNTRR